MSLEERRCLSWRQQASTSTFIEFRAGPPALRRLGIRELGSAVATPDIVGFVTMFVQKSAGLGEIDYTVRWLPLSQVRVPPAGPLVDPLRNLLIDPRFRVSRPYCGGRAFR